MLILLLFFAQQIYKIPTLKAGRCELFLLKNNLSSLLFCETLLYLCRRF